MTITDAGADAAARQADKREIVFHLLIVKVKWIIQK